MGPLHILLSVLFSEMKAFPAAQLFPKSAALPGYLQLQGTWD